MEMERGIKREGERETKKGARWRYEEREGGGWVYEKERDEERRGEVMEMKSN